MHIVKSSKRVVSRSKSDHASKLHPIVLQQLFNLGQLTHEDHNKFLKPKPSHNISPFLLRNMEKAAARVRKADHFHQHILIITDNRCDTLIAGALLIEPLHKETKVTKKVITSLDNVVNQPLVASLIERDPRVRLIITIGLRIESEAVTGCVAGKNIDIISINNGEITPKDYAESAIMLVNPNQEDDQYPHKELSNSALINKLNQGKELLEMYWLLRSANQIPPYSLGEPQDRNHNPRVDELLTIAMIAEGKRLDELETRWDYHYGIKALRKTRRLGLRILLEFLGVNASEIDSQMLSSVIVPAINTACREYGGGRMIELLHTRSKSLAEEYARYYFAPHSLGKGLGAFMRLETNDKPELNDTTPPIEIALGDLNQLLYEGLELLEPTGIGNPPVTFLTRNVCVVPGSVQLTRGNKDLSFVVTDDKGNRFNCKGWGMGDRAREALPEVDIIYRLGPSGPEGERFCLNLVDMKPSLSFGKSDPLL